MSRRLVDRGNTTVTVRPYKRTKTDLGSDVSYGHPVTISQVTVQPITNTESGDGHTVRTEYKLIIGTSFWPGGPLSRVTIHTPPYAGEYDQVGEPAYRTGSPMTTHTTITVRKRGTEAK